MGTWLLRLLRFTWRAWWLFLWLLGGLLTLGLLFPCLPLQRRLSIKRRWSRGLLWISGIDLHVSGQVPEQAAVLWVANHVSWLDIFVLNAVRSTTFVAKHEIRAWPLVGWLVAGADTIFIERGHRHAVHRVGQAMQRKFESHQAVGLFPEGTTSEGLDLLPFYANLFEPAKRSLVPIQPVALRYFHHGQRSGFAAFVGEENLMQNLWRVLGTTGISVEMVFLTALPLQSVQTLKRNELACQAREAILAVITDKSQRS